MRVSRPAHANRPHSRECRSISILRCGIARTSILLVALTLLSPIVAQAQHFDGAKAYEYAREFAAIGPRWPTGPGHVKAEEFLRAHFLRAHDQLEEDTFTADTPIGPVPMCNFIVRFPGKKPGVIVLGTHYETNYPLRNINFVGANDGASTTGLLMAIADQLRAQAAHSTGNKLDGYSVWLVFFDGEEAIQQWSRSDSTYGSRHLAAKWGRDGTLNQIKAFMLADMIGDKDLDIQRETHSTPGWLRSSPKRQRSSATSAIFSSRRWMLRTITCPLSSAACRRSTSSTSTTGPTTATTTPRRTRWIRSARTA